MMNRKWLHTLLVSTMTVGCGMSQSTYAALALPDSPLFLGSQPQPNIMFAVDDSGSMAWEILLSDGALVDHPFNPNSGNLDVSPNTEAEDLEFCSGYNVLAYNPDVTYEPWTGEDDTGASFTDASVTAARTNPYLSGSSTVNLLNVTGGKPALYGIWTDADGDEVYDIGECPASPPDNSLYVNRNYTEPDWIFVSDLSPAEQTNYANWYVYYRKRDYVLKKVLSDLLAQSTDRLGLVTLHNNNSVGIPIKDMTIPANKEDMVVRLFSIQPSGSTPLRRTLNNVGQYFDDTDGASAPSQLGFSDSSPILPESEGGSCQQNFTILMSDGFWNNSFFDVGNEDADGTGNDTEWDGGPHADTYSTTLADVAMKYYEKDLSSLPDIVPEVEGADSNTTQHMVTYTVAFGLSGSGLTTPADHEPTTPPPPWTQPISDTLTTLDDMQHAAYNARGLFLNASDPQSLITSFTEAFADIQTRTTFTSTAVAINSTVLRTGARLFTALFNSQDWTGELRSFTLKDDGTLDTEQWEAGAILDATSNSFRMDPTNGRKMFTIVDKSGIPTPISFDNTDTDLVTAVGSAGTINYIRGDQSSEIQNGGALRDRNSILADIIKSSPVSSGAENFSYDLLDTSDGGGNTYLTYLGSKKSLYTDSNGSFSMVYVGTNGGTLHAIDSRDGSEKFAYVPKTTHGNLNLLTDPDYGHKFFANASGFAADAFIDLGSGKAWKTLYISGLGEGGRGIFALDITDPLTAPDTSNVLWERNSADAADSDFSELGYITFRPRLVFLNNGEWGIILGNGYNSDLERAQLFILNPVNGDIITVIDTEEDGASNPDLPTNGLGEPFLLDADGNQTVDFVYAGDLQGNIWKFDLTSSSPGTWKSEFFKAGAPEPFYTALDDNGNRQPITTRPVLSPHPDGGFMVMFGTGKYLVPSDNALAEPPDVQSFYGIWDDTSDEVDPGRTDLQEQIILAEVDITDNDGNVINRARIVSEDSNTVDYSSQKGWYIDLLTPAVLPATDPIAQGEMVIADPLTRFGRAIFTTFIPGNTPCDRGGQSVIMEVDAVNGTRLQNSVFDFNNDGVIDASDLLAYGGGDVPGSGIFIPATLASPAVITTTDASAEYKQTAGMDTDVTATLEATGGVTVGRQSWRQLR